MSLPRSLLSLLVALTATPLLAQSKQWNDINLALTDQVVLPAYERFAQATAPLVTDSVALCAGPSAEKLVKLQGDFHNAMDAWQSVQHIQFGPITYFNWNYRVQFWPDDKGAGNRQLDVLLASGNSAALEPTAFAQQSVGVQGFQALERLLFDKDSLAELQKAPFRCQLVQAISRNLGEISSNVSKRWKEEFRSTIANADKGGSQFENAEDATLDYLKAVVENVRKIAKDKLHEVTGDTQSAAKERKAESWRADRSVRNIRQNVTALAALFGQSKPALSSVFVTADIAPITQAFAKVQTSMAKVPDSMTAALKTPEGYAALKQLHDDLGALYEKLEAAVKHTDFNLGFNSLDGD